MKPELIAIIAIALITGFCVTRSLHDGTIPVGPPTHTMTSSNGDDYEQIVRTGSIVINQDTTAIASITPGGCLRYTYNNKKMFAEASDKGAITYTFFLDGDKTTYDPKFLALALKTTIARKFDK